MKKFLMIAAMLTAFSAPAFANDAEEMMEHAAPVAEHAMKEAAPVAEHAMEEAAPAADEAMSAKEECTAQTNEKVKLPEDASEAEKAQWDAAFAECLQESADSEDEADMEESE